MNTPQHAIDAANELLPCPFCGEIPIVDFTEDHSEACRPNSWLVCCATAYCYGNAFTLDNSFHSRAHACEAWNNRAVHPDPETARLRDENERLKESFRISSQNYANLLSGVKKMHTLIGQEFYSWQRIYQWIERAIAERDQLRARVTTLEQRILDDNKAFGCELRDPNGTIWEHADKLQKENADLRQSLENHAQANDKLAVEVDDLRLDREDLDWLEKHFHEVRRQDPGPTMDCEPVRFSVWTPEHGRTNRFTDLRSAVRAARAKDAKTEGGV